jgi:hypothetical protein
VPVKYSLLLDYFMILSVIKKNINMFLLLKMDEDSNNI